MSDTIFGVIVGGVIASIAPLSMLYFNHRHWKQETKLNHLKSERTRLESLSEKTLAKLAKAMSENAYPSDMTADIITFMPEEVIKRFDKFMCDTDITEQKKQMTGSVLTFQQFIDLWSPLKDHERRMK